VRKRLNQHRVRRAPFLPQYIQGLLERERAVRIRCKYTLVQEQGHRIDAPARVTVVVYHGEHVQAVIVVDRERCARERVPCDGPGVAGDSADESVRGGEWEVQRSEVHCWGRARVGSHEFE
jgi:hypothetical protein